MILTGPKLVHNDWLQAVRQKTLCDGKWSKEICRDDAALYLAPSHQKIPNNWTRICIKVIKKSDKLCPKLHNGPLYNAVPVDTCMEHLVQNARENFRNLWTAAHVKYSHGDLDSSNIVEDQFTNVVRMYLHRLSPDIYINIPDHHHDKPPLCSQSTDTLGNNNIPVLAVIETMSTFFIVQPYIPCSLQDIVSYSPALFDTSHAKSLFVLYQILHSMKEFHRKGLSVSELNLQNVRIDDKLWVHCTSVKLSRLIDIPDQMSISKSDNSTSVLSIPAPANEQGNSAISSEFDISRMKNVSDISNVTDVSELRVRSISRLSETENYQEDADDVMNRFQYLHIPLDNLAKLTEDWVHHRINNFKYLMYLNHLAGRRLGDPNHHPVLPWVMDFTSSNSGYRNLSMSKFRINKGDSQLDFTFEAMAELGGEGEHIPHHVSDVLSDITYYVYKARRTQKHILCSYVRTKWVPNEYPQSIERMYQWTPDECIPEFFTDPTIFSSIHEDLPDLDIPHWCTSAAEFIERHMAALESEQVSVNLHNWIDLTFGYKLSGTSAVKSKNVYLHLVDQHKHLTNHGVVQLFTHPHPHRLTSDKIPSLLPIRVKRSETNSGIESRQTVDRDPNQTDTPKIKLPAEFDPTAALDHFEALHSFTSETMECLPPSTRVEKRKETLFSDNLESVKMVWADMQQFGCLMCEMFLAPKLHTHKPGTSLIERYNMIGRLCASDRSKLPRIIQTSAEILLNLDNFKEITDPVQPKNNEPSLLFEYPIVTSLGTQPPTPALLVQPFSNIIPFPPYFTDLFKVLNEMKEIDRQIEIEINDISKSKEKKKIEKNLSRKKVDVLETYLKKNRGKISEEGYELLLPYIKELFQDPKTTVQAAWSLLGVVGKELGPAELGQNLMPYLIQIFSGEATSPKHMKLYHRSFLVQLLLHLGLETFLTNFCTLLVEAVAGYKNFEIAEEDPDMTQDDLDEEVEEVLSGNQSMPDEQSITDDQSAQDEQIDLQEADLLEENDDIRPDQAEECEEDLNPEANDDDDYIDDELEDEFPNISGHNHSRSTDSFSNDQLSQRSTESDVNHDEDSARGSSDRASIHSISHIIEMSQDREPDSENQSTEGGEPKMKTSQSVHFEVNEKLDSDLDTSSQSKEEKFSEDQSNDSDGKTSSYMIRSETDEFRQIHYSHTINICDVAAESIKWLSHRLGPLLTAKYLSKNLVRMLALCYLGEEQVTLLSTNSDDLPKSTRLVQGDRNAHKVLECLSSVSAIYGEQVILLQYIPCIIDLIHVAKKRLTVRGEAGLVAAVVLLRHVIPLLSDKTLFEMLEESVIKEAVKPMLRLVSSATVSFPSGSVVRSIILYKIIDVLYVIGLRLGFEMNRRLLTTVLQLFFKPFEQVYSSESAETMTTVGTGGSSTDLRNGIYTASKDSYSADESFLNIKMDSTTQQYMIGSPVSLAISPNPADHLKKYRTTKSSYSLADIHTVDDRDEVDLMSASEEILQSDFRQTYSPELALAAYIPLTSVFGSHHMEEYLANDDLIRKLCSQYDKALYTEYEDTGTAESGVGNVTGTTNDSIAGELGSNVAMVGNRLCLQAENKHVETTPETFQLRKHFQHKGILRMDPDETRSDDTNHNKHRHLKGNWLAYWEHELGLNERDTLFNFKQIKLQTFQGHTNSVRSITCLDNENSFISASKDKTVKLWSLNSFGDGQGKCRCQYSYGNHKKSVFSVAYLENLRLVASCDSAVHVWDPFTSDIVRQLESSRYSPVIALTPLPSPSTVVVTATQDSTLRFLDMRAARYAHEYRCVIGNHGMIRCLTASPDGNWVAVGFSTGIISVLDLHTGLLLGSWKGHDSEILQLKAFNRVKLVSTSFDSNMKLWNIDSGTSEICSLKGHTEPIHCLRFYKNQIVSATANNKIGVHTSVDQQANFTSAKLRSEVFKGVTTCMEILPLNRTLLLGADNGLIRLLC